jgi:hypothetical protein
LGTGSDTETSRIALLRLSRACSTSPEDARAWIGPVMNPRKASRNVPPAEFLVLIDWISHGTASRSSARCVYVTCDAGSLKYTSVIATRRADGANVMSLLDR